MDLVYSCVFFQWNYINLLNLLLKSYALTEDKKDITYLVICHPKFKEHIENLFKSLNIDGKIWCLELTTLFEAGYSRLFIFDYPEITNYKKILYLDTDIIINKNLTIILNNELEDKIYAMKEGDTNSIYHGSQFFTGSNPNMTTFTSAILLFNNCDMIKNLFNETLNHIKQYLSDGNPIPGCLDQPFIVYNAVIRNLYNNEMILEYADGIVDSYNNKVLSHFPCGPGNYGDKVQRMSNFLRIIMEKRVDENNYLLYKKYTWQNSIIEFLPNGKMNAFGSGAYKYIDTGLVKADFGGREHFLRFNEDHTSFISVRKDDFESVKGQIVN